MKRIFIILLALIVFYSLYEASSFSQDSGKHTQETADTQNNSTKKSDSQSAEPAPISGTSETKSEQMESIKQEPASLPSTQESAPVEKPKPAEKKQHIKTTIEGRSAVSAYPGIPLYIGVGAMIPVSDYGDDYSAGPLVSLGTMFYRFNLWHFAPAFHMRYNYYDSKPNSEKVTSKFDILQITPGLVFWWDFNLPPSKVAFFRYPLTFYVRVSDGLSMLSFKTKKDPNAVIGAPSNIVEWNNTFELSVGITYPLYKILELGFDFGYRLIATAPPLMHSLQFSVTIGVRI